MRLRSLLVAATLLGLASLPGLPATASAQEVVPLTGKGEKFAPIARMKLPGVVTELAVAGDWAFVATDAVEEKCGCLYIINIKDPANPFIEGTFDAAKTELTAQEYGDVDISPDANLAVLTNAHGDGPTWAVLIDTTDKANPKLLSKIDDDGTMEYVHTSTLDNNTLYMNPQVAAFFPQPGNAHVTVVDISERSKPVIMGKLTGPASDAGLAHDSYVDHRPDGKTLFYGASVHRSDVFDVTNPAEPTWLQSSSSPHYTISHDVQPNHDRTLIVVDDEGAAGGQLDEGVSACGQVGSGPATITSGSVHFFEAAPDGTFASGGANRLGSFNAPPTVNEGACVAHVFWQAPDQNRLTQAYYNIGAWVIDYTDPAAAEALGHFDADDGKYWSAKPHNGFLYATNMNGSLDIMRYTGEGWPANAGPAEIQLSARQGVPYVPITGTTQEPPKPGTGPGSKPVAKAFGRFKFKIKAKARKVPGKRGRKTKLKLIFKNATGKRVARKKLKLRARRRAKVKVSGVAAIGTYKWVLKARKRKVARGRFTVRPVQNLLSSKPFVARAKVKKQKKRKK